MFKHKTRTYKKNPKNFNENPVKRITKLSKVAKQSINCENEQNTKKTVSIEQK